MKRLLSTKILTDSQKKIIADTAIELTDYNAIKIAKKDFELPKNLENCIFTSQHAVNIFLEEAKKQQLAFSKIRAFCVGQKTAGLLHSNGIKVVFFSFYAKDLSAYLIDKHRSSFFNFFCGNLRRNTLPESFKTHNIKYKETQIYNTILQPRQWNKEFDGILFFSPSGIQSYVANNTIPPQTQVFCIGNTTANEAQKHSSNIHISATTSVKSVLEKVLTEFYN